MREPEVLTIDGTRYSVQQLMPKKAIRLLPKMMRAFGEPLAQLAMSGGIKSLNDISSKPDSVHAAFQALAMHCTEDAVDDIMTELLSCVYVNSTCVNEDFDVRFQGKLDAVFKLCAKSLEVNFGGFFGTLVSRGRQALQASQAASNAQST